MEILAAIIGAIVGAFISGTVGWKYQQKQFDQNNNRQKELFLSGLVDDLVHSSEIYKRLAENWEAHKMISVVILNELIDARQFYNNNRTYLILIEDAELRNNIAEYFRKSAIDIDLLKANEAQADNIQQQFNAMVTNALLANQELTRDQARELVHRAAPQYANDFGKADEVRLAKLPAIERYRGISANLAERLKEQ